MPVVNVNGVNLNYEVAGQGPVLVFSTWYDRQYSGLGKSNTSSITESQGDCAGHAGTWQIGSAKNRGGLLNINFC